MKNLTIIIVEKYLENYLLEVDLFVIINLIGVIKI